MKLKRLTALLLSVFAFAGGVAAFAGCKSKDNTENASGTEQGGSESNNYSQILQTVLESEYYNDVVINNLQTISGNVIHAIPNNFLKSQGYDIEKIKDDRYKCESFAYACEGDSHSLYVSTKIENDATLNGEKFYTDYLLKYSITDKELKDLKFLHDNVYIEAPLFIQEFDRQKTPTVLNTSQITVSAITELENTFSNNKDLNISGKVLVNYEYGFITPDGRATIVKFNLLKKPSPYKLTSTSEKTNLKMATSPRSGASIENNIFNIVDSEYTYVVESEENYTENITAFYSDGWYYQESFIKKIKQSAHKAGCFYFSFRTKYLLKFLL